MLSCFCAGVRGRAAAALRRLLWPLSGALGLCLAVLLTQAAGRQAEQFSAACAAVRADTLRLHIRAASDSVADQTAKLRVRDAVLELTERLYGGAATQAEAKAVAARSLPRIALAASHALWRMGGAETAKTVSVYLANEYFTVKQYGEYTLPAGYYDALCIRIGSGRGQNWWCCLYPQLCLVACSGYAAPDEQALVVGEYEVRFRLAEWWDALTGADGRTAEEEAGAAGMASADPAARQSPVCTAGR